MSRPQTGISVLTNGEMATTGRRKKNDCIRGTDIEMLLGLDVQPEQGMRVMISQRGREQKVIPPGNPCAGTVQRVLDRGLRCEVKWDNGYGPFAYSTSQVSGMQLTLVDPGQEPAQAVRLRDVTVILARDSEHGANGEVLKDFFNALEEGGQKPNIIDDEFAVNDSSWGASLPRCKLCVVVLDSSLFGQVQRSGPLKPLLEYAAQVPSNCRRALIIEQ